MNKEILNKSITWGLITGLVYVVLILLQNMFFANNVVSFGLVKTLCYLVIIGFFVATALNARKLNGGLISLQEAFGAIFVAILIAEAFYGVFNLIYVKYIDPNFLEKVTNGSIEMLEKANMPQEKIDEAVANMKEGQKKQYSIGAQIQGYLFSVIIDSIFAIIIAAIIKKDKKVSFE